MIRRATLADVPGLRAAIEAAYGPFQDAGLDLPPVSDGLDDDVRDNFVWVAETNLRILGGVVLVLRDDQAHLANLAVHPDAAGQGIGRALINTATTAARDKGFTTIALATHADMTATRAFYARLGWTETGSEGTKAYMSLNLKERTAP